ncbi:NADPH oxidase 5-like [Portunus trituberculatus]|uniref:NADPH oxidase 5-like n=1 Tax=Portunus trituberculatus TaxID=210409 RepID=UPI001E1D09EE|nr:NADPH oxidase 5-like [Portunus trituberculatus]XP_045113366.1 NADPH oxidase 5-like [Portunus trituberculatus]XP_045113367.1 NADPH oxidase 5-like [Portunus trituberculatus]XP_045113370.1 NADPH oxidase 5-like [Portunus trituberculatus]
MMRKESRIRFLDVVLDEERPEPESITTQSSLRRRLLWARNNAPTLVFTALFVGVNAAVFLARAYQYRHTNILEMGARACGQCLNLDCALLLLLILRRTVTRLRSSSVGHLLPCDQHVHFHKMAGWTVFLLSILHTLFHIANFVTLGDVTGISLNDYMWDTRLGIGWVAGLANPTGAVLMILLTIIVAFSHRLVRKSGYFEIFYWTHLLSLPFWVLLVLHGPNFWKWLLLPGIAFLMETGLRVSQVCTPRGQTHILGGTTLPSRVVKLLIRRPKNFDFQPGEYVYLNVPSLARYEWHPFTISSAPEFEDYFTVHVRSVGEWTRRIYDMFKEEAKEEKEEKPAVQEGKDSPGMFNLAYSSDEDLREDATHTVIEVEEQDTGSQKGGRYINNLLEFNRKMSIYSRPAALLNVEMQRKPSVSPAAMESRCSGSFLTLERKKSCSLSNLAALKADLESSRRGDSGQSSLTGSTSSLDSVGENLCSTLARTRQHCFPSQNAAQNPDTMAHQLQLHSAIKKKIEVHVDGPYGTPSTRIFTVTHAVLIGAGIGVTPFASILQSVMMRYRAAKAPCPYCQVPSCLALPTTLRKLRKVDFVWVNRDLGSFEWFLEMLAALEEEQRVVGAAMETFLNLHLYKTGANPLSPSLPLASSIRTGRPDWDKVFSGIRESRVGKVCVFYCGPPSLVSVLRDKCIKYKFEFKREMF